MSRYDNKFTLTTYPTGTTWDLFAPSAEDVHIEDLVWAKANGCVRFGGHIRGRYSVAQHEVLVHDLLTGLRGWPDEAAWKELGTFARSAFNSARRPNLDEQADLCREAGLHALFHDGHEAYLGDLIGPLKDLLRSMGEPFGMLSPWDMLERRHDEAIFEALGLGFYWDGEYDGPEKRRFGRVVHAADKEAYRIEKVALRAGGTAADLDLLPGGRILDEFEAANLFLTRARIYGIEIDDFRPEAMP